MGLVSYAGLSEGKAGQDELIYNKLADGQVSKAEPGSSRGLHLVMRRSHLGDGDELEQFAEQ